MQPDPSITFISPKNRRVWCGKRKYFARHDETFEHVARQASMPPLPQWRETRRIKAYIGYAGIGAFLIGVFVLGLGIAWCIAVEFWRYLGDYAMGMGLAIILSVVLLTYPWRTQRLCDQFIYPPCVIQLYQQLLSSGQLTVGKVQSIETLAESKYLIHYQFTLPADGQSIIGQYATDRQFPVGARLAIIYLDAKCHALL